MVLIVGEIEIDYSRLDVRSKLDALASKLDALNTTSEQINTKQDILAAKLDALTSELVRLRDIIRYGRELLGIFWVYGADVTAPAAGAALVSYTPAAGSGRRAWIYGFYIDSSEGNAFEIRWTSGGTVRSYRLRTSGAGTLHVVFAVPINEGILPDVETAVSINVVNAGAAGSVYKAGLLIGETT